MLSYRPGLSLVATRPFTSTVKYPFVRFVFWSVAPLSQKPCFTPLIQVFGSPVLLDLLPQQSNIHLSVSSFGLLLLFPKNLASLRSFRFSGALLKYARVRGSPASHAPIQQRTVFITVFFVCSSKSRDLNPYGVPIKRYGLWGIFSGSP